MNESTLSNQPCKTARFPVPLPRPSGIVTLLISGLSFAAGHLRNEIVLLFVSFMLFACLAYSFAAVLLLSFIHIKAARALSTRLVPEKVSAGSDVMLFLNGAAGRAIFRQLPAVLVRYKLSLATKDGKRIDHIFARDFFSERQTVFTVPLRGLYTGEKDKLIIFDAFGFFLTSYNINCGCRERLSVSPKLSTRGPCLPRFSGGGEHRGEREIIRTDDLVEQRPYLPGDDPRRINWKLFGHLGSLFVREEDREPPPHTRLALLVCSEVDDELGTIHTSDVDYGMARHGAAAVDMLCETALAVVAECSERGVDVFIGSCGAEFTGGDVETSEDALALPFAARIGKAEALPKTNDEKETLILALPRSARTLQAALGTRGTRRKKIRLTALDSFLNAKNTGQKVTIFFIYDDDQLAGPAEASVMFYSRIEGVYAKAIRF